MKLSIARVSVSSRTPQTSSSSFCREQTCPSRSIEIAKEIRLHQRELQLPFADAQFEVVEVDDAAAELEDVASRLPSAASLCDAAIP